MRSSACAAPRILEGSPAPAEEAGAGLGLSRRWRPHRLEFDVLGRDRPGADVPGHAFGRRIQGGALHRLVLEDERRPREQRNRRNGCHDVMIRFIRYSLAAVCFAASVGCLALWWRSITTYDRVEGPILSGDKSFFFLISHGGSASLATIYPASHEPAAWKHISEWGIWGGRETKGNIRSYNT